jgi:dTDP-4-amino-4,6-dideoxygalactose transaminase
MTTAAKHEHDGIATGAPSRLALHGGPRVRAHPFPARHLFGEEEKSAVMELFDEYIRTGAGPSYDGPREHAYCREFAAYMGGGYADLVSSGSTATYVALQALGIEPFTEVICPAITDPGGIMPAALIGCIPVVADARPGSYNVGPEQIEACISERTSAMIVAHIAGEPADMDPILEIARARNIPVIEDCSQAHGARYKGQLVGTFGDVAAISTMSGKHHGTGLQGGVVFTRREDVYWAARRYADRGKPAGPQATYDPFNDMRCATNVVAALNLNSNELAATIGLVQLKKLDGTVARRRAMAAAIAEGLAQRSRVVSPGWQHEGAAASYWYLRLHVDASQITTDATTFAKAIAAEGLPVMAVYGAAMQAHAPWLVERRVFGTSGYPWSAPEYRARGGDPDCQFPCPNAVAVIESDFNLLFHERWGDAEIADTLAAIEKVEEAFAAC